MKSIYISYLIIAITVPIAGEFKFYPFEGTLRISLGPPLFLFYLLYFPRLNPIISGILVGFSVVVFRVFLELLSVDSSTVYDALALHLPSFSFYFVYGLAFHLLHLRRYLRNPWLLIILAAVCEIFANHADLFLRNPIDTYYYKIETFFVICGVAAFRSIIVVALFQAINIRQEKKSKIIQEMRTQELLILISDLYTETVQLNHSAKNAEELTHKCFKLHTDLKEDSLTEYSGESLKIAQLLHEIKKDNQRVYAGLQKIMKDKQVDDFMTIHEIVKMVVTSNSKYSNLLEKNIDISFEIKGKHSKYHSFQLTSLINNLVSNAVEAIKKDGEVYVSADLVDGFLEVSVSDNGSGVQDKHKKLIFSPGFTTKFDEDGNSSNGIGLSHLKTVIEDYEGSINFVESKGKFNTIFIFKIPSKSLSEGKK